jgi:hypothetical protein
MIRNLPLAWIRVLIMAPSILFMLAFVADLVVFGSASSRTTVRLFLPGALYVYMAVVLVAVPDRIFQYDHGPWTRADRRRTARGNMAVAAAFLIAAGVFAFLP